MLRAWAGRGGKDRLSLNMRPGLYFMYMILFYPSQPPKVDVMRFVFQSVIL